MALGVEVGLGPGDFVFDGEPAPPHKKKAQPPHPIFDHVYCGQTAAWTKMPLGTEVGLDLRDIVLDGESALAPVKGHSPPPPIFGQCPLWSNGWMD